MAMVNFKAAAVQIGVSIPKVRQLVRERAIPHFRVGRRIVFDTEEVRAWLSGHRVPVGGSDGAGSVPSAPPSEAR